MFYTYIARNVENPQVENKQSLERKCLSDLIIQQSVFGGQFVLLKERLDRSLLENLIVYTY